MNEHLFFFLPLKNLLRRGNQSLVLALLCALLSFISFFGLMIVSALGGGVASLSMRLGADLMVTPDDADEERADGIFLNGSPDSFFMSADNLTEISSLEGIDRISAQLCLASAPAGCCDMQVQLIGFDPETDFTVSPWLSEGGIDALKKGEVVLGSSVMGKTGQSVRFFDVPLRVAGRLSSTGTGYDRAVFTGMDTLKVLMKAALSKGFEIGTDETEDEISCILIDLKEGFDPLEMKNAIEVRVDGVRAESISGMTSGIRDSLDGFVFILRLLIAGVFILCFVILILTFSLTFFARRKEAALLRVLGLSKGGLVRSLILEAAIVSLAGGLAGALFGLGLTFPFFGVMKERLSIALLLPSAAKTLAYGAAGIGLGLASGLLASVFCVLRIGLSDPGKFLREDH